MMVLALLVERSKGSHSLWAEYISLLPEIFTVPASFTTEEASCLPTWHQMHRTHTQNLWHSYLSALEYVAGITNLFPQGLPTRQEVEWASTAVQTRSVQMSEPFRAGLIPWLCLPNHDSVRGVEMVPVGGPGKSAPVSTTLMHAANLQSRIVPKEIELQLIFAGQDLSAGDEVYLSYGDWSIQDLYLRYGFVPRRPALVSVDELAATGKGSLCSEIHGDHEIRLCLTNADQMLNVDDRSFPGVKLPRLGCRRFQPHKRLKPALEKCAQQVSSQPQAVLQEALQVTIADYEAAIATSKCKRSEGNFPSINRMRRVALLGLHTALHHMQGT